MPEGCLGAHMQDGGTRTANVAMGEKQVNLLTVTHGHHEFVRTADACPTDSRWLVQVGQTPIPNRKFPTQYFPFGVHPILQRTACPVPPLGIQFISPCRDTSVQIVERESCLSRRLGRRCCFRALLMWG